MNTVIKLVYSSYPVCVLDVTVSTGLFKSELKRRVEGGGKPGFDM